MTGLGQSILEEGMQQGMRRVCSKEGFRRWFWIILKSRFQEKERLRSYRRGFFEEAAMLEPMAVAVHAMRRTAISDSDTIAVLWAWHDRAL